MHPSTGPLHQPHDALIRYAFSRVEHAAEVLRAIVPPDVAALIDWSSLKLLPGTFVDEALRRSHCDLLFEARMQDQKVLIYLLVEHQSTSDPLMPLRLLGYMQNGWRDHAHAHGLPLPFLIPLVLHQGESDWRYATQLAALFEGDEATRTKLARYVPDFSMLVYELGAVSSEHLRAQASFTALARIALVLLSRARSVKHFVAEFLELVPLFRVVLQSATGRDDFAALIRYILEVTDIQPEEVLALIRDRLPEPATEVVMTAAEELMRRGEARGRAEGEARGRAETLLRLMRVRFGAVTEAQEARVRTASADTLDQWVEAILTVQSAEELLAQS